MSDNRNFGKPIPDDKMNALLKVLVNTWWAKWRRMALNDDLFLQAMHEWEQIMKQGDEYPMVTHLGISFLYELSARLTGGYTDTTRNKILSIIQGGGHGPDRNSN